MDQRTKAKRLYRNQRRVKIGITMGDAAGIGPEVALKALSDGAIRKLASFILIGNSRVLEKTASVCKIELKSDIELVEIGNIPQPVFGKAISYYGSVALDCIKAALKLIADRRIDALVTAPVNKHTITKSGLAFKGHTEYLASATKSKNFAMMLIGGPLKVVLASRHIALKDVAASLSKEKIYQAIALTNQALKQYFCIDSPRIGVCGLNPHSGEGGTIGTEEIKFIQPAVSRARRFARVAGPLPADTLFYFARQGKFDAVVAMYHDQGLIPLKMLALHQGVNLTLGLPFIRTSPDHGTAYELAGKNKANPGSMKEAIKLAVKIGLRIKRF